MSAAGAPVSHGACLEHFNSFTQSRLTQVRSSIVTRAISREARDRRIAPRGVTSNAGTSQSFGVIFQPKHPEKCQKATRPRQCPRMITTKRVPSIKKAQRDPWTREGNVLADGAWVPSPRARVSEAPRMVTTPATTPRWQPEWRADGAADVAEDDEDTRPTSNGDEMVASVSVSP